MLMHNIRLKSSRIRYVGLVNICSFKILFMATKLSTQSSSDKDIKYIFQQSSINIFPSCSLSITMLELTAKFNGLLPVGVFFETIITREIKLDTCVTQVTLIFVCIICVNCSHFALT